jgi:chemotaxis protein MotB
MRLPSLFPSRNVAGTSDPASGVWLITFTDLVGLMLAFFIMMYSMSKIDEQRWGKLVAQLGPAAGAAETVAPPPPAVAPTEVPMPERGRDTDYLAVLLPRQIAEHPELAVARVVPGPGRVDVVLPQDALLQPGGATLSPSGRAAAEAMTAILANLPNAARVEARAGGRARQPQDWTQAMARAAAVASALTAAGYDRPLEARAYVAPQAGGSVDSISFVILE